MPTPEERARRAAEEAARWERAKAHAAAHPLTEEQKAELRAITAALNAAFRDAPPKKGG